MWREQSPPAQPDWQLHLSSDPPVQRPCPEQWFGQCPSAGPRSHAAATTAVSNTARVGRLISCANGPGSSRRRVVPANAAAQRTAEQRAVALQCPALQQSLEPVPTQKAKPNDDCERVNDGNRLPRYSSGPQPHAWWSRGLWCNCRLRSSSRAGWGAAARQAQNPTAWTRMGLKKRWPAVHAADLAGHNCKPSSWNVVCARICWQANSGCRAPAKPRGPKAAACAEGHIHLPRRAAATTVQA